MPKPTRYKLVHLTIFEEQPDGSMSWEGITDFNATNGRDIRGHELELVRASIIALQRMESKLSNDAEGCR